MNKREIANASATIRAYKALLGCTLLATIILTGGCGGGKNKGETGALPSSTISPSLSYKQEGTSTASGMPASASPATSQAQNQDQNRNQSQIQSPSQTQPPSQSQSQSQSPSRIQSPTRISTASPEDQKLAEEYYEKGYAQYNDFNYNEAIRLFDMALKADSASYKALNGKGIALCFKGSYLQGMELIRESLAIKPDFAYANFNMAMAYKLQKDYDNALLWFGKAAAIDPGDPWTYYGISTIYADRRDSAKALEFLKKAIDLDSSVKGVARSQSHYTWMAANPQFIAMTKE